MRLRLDASLIVSSVFTFTCILLLTTGNLIPSKAQGQPTPAPVTQNADWTPQLQAFEGVNMALVPPGCFKMGSTQEQIAAMKQRYGDGFDTLKNETPQHEICFDKPFWIDQTELTNSQFEQFKGQAGKTSKETGADQPREQITWAEAKAFCEQRAGRLPTEAEWEYAARGPDGLVYPWGDEFVKANVIGLDTSRENKPALVGTKPEGASWVGVLDMSGNVAEWTSSLLKDYPYDAADGREGEADAGEKRVARGGRWSGNPKEVRATVRDAYRADTAYNYIGVRCARDF